MRIAIATYGEMISPRFDCASTLRVLEYAGNGQSDHREELLQLTEDCGRADLLLRQGVSALICGGIRRCDYYRLVDAGLEVVAGHFGPYVDVFREYAAGRLKSQPSWERPRSCWTQGQGQGQGRGQGRGMGSGMGRGGGMGRGRGQSGRGGSGQGPRGGGSGPGRK